MILSLPWKFSKWAYSYDPRQNRSFEQYVTVTKKDTSPQIDSISGPIISKNSLLLSLAKFFLLLIEDQSGLRMWHLVI